MASEEHPEIMISETRELLSNAQQLMREIEDLLDWCTLTGHANPKRPRMTQQECEACIEEDGETLVIEGFRFESATSSEELRRLRSEAGARGRQSNS